MSEWQPIESAPKDGTKILAFARNPEYAPDTYMAVAEWATAKPAFGSVAGWFWPYAIRPTHWMHLPTAPEAPESRSRDSTRDGTEE